MHQVGPGRTGGHLQVDAHGPQGGVRAVQSRRILVADHPGLAARGTETMHAHVEGEAAQFTRQILQVNAGTAIDVGGILE
ncbi:hypothetical protein GCM10027610_078610 [Dactylosporangium cerinum]